MTAVTLAALEQVPLDRAEVYLARLKGCVVLQELTGAQLAKAAKWARRRVGGTEGSVEFDQAAFQNIRIALALAEPALGSTDEEKAGKVSVIERLPAADALLLSAVIERLGEGTLSDADRDMLKSDLPPARKLEALGVSQSPASVIEATPEEHLSDLYLAALHVPQVLFGQIPSSVCTALAEAARERDAVLARAIAENIAELLMSHG